MAIITRNTTLSLNGTGSGNNAQSGNQISLSPPASPSRHSAENDPELGLAASSNRVVTYTTSEYSRSDHFWGLLGVDMSKRKSLDVRRKYVQEIPYQPLRKIGIRWGEEGNTHTKYISFLNLDFGISTIIFHRKDRNCERVDLIKVECTMNSDMHTGGSNVISKKCVQDALGPEEADYLLLSEEEKRWWSSSASGLVPEGAIYITWKVEHSSRTFLRTRFLISSSSNHDLVLGSRFFTELNLVTHEHSNVTLAYQSGLGQGSITALLWSKGAHVLLLFLTGILVLVLYAVIKNDLGTGAGLCTLIWSLGGAGYSQYHRLRRLFITKISAE